MAEPVTKLPLKTEEKREAERSPAPSERRPFESLRRELDRLVDDFDHGAWRLPFRRTMFDVEPFWRGEISFGAIPAVDIKETDAGYEVTAELPGVVESDINVKFSDDTLTINAEKHEEKEEKKANYFLSERHYGSLKRSFRVADGIDAEKIEANFKNGVLKVTMPRTLEARKKTKTVTISKA